MVLWAGQCELLSAWLVLTSTDDSATICTGNLRGCVKCDIRGMYITGLHKYTYGDHRRLLPMSHPFRHDGRWGDACNVPPCLKNSHSSLCRAAAAVAAARARGISANAADDPAKATGVTGLPALTQLVYWDWARCELVDAMHCNFNQGANVLFASLMLLQQAQGSNALGEQCNA